MTPQFLLALAAITLGGACAALQAPVNARLGGHLGDPVAAAAASFAVGFAVLAAVTILRGSVPGLAQAAAAPWWAWAGGALGAVYVWSAVWSVGTLGVLTMVAGLILGQLVAALAIDAVGAFGLQVREISWTRIAAVGFVGVGLLLSRL
jgi:transporter family-2 protein